MKYRKESDALGEVQIPSEAYYGINTLRSKENFEITKRGISRQMIKAIAIVKKSCAKANYDAGLLDDSVTKAIMNTCDEILNGKHHGQFITDLIQGGAGTSINMNANEVIANRANEFLGGKKGTYEFVHPLDHVNLCQSTNDVIPTAGKVALIKQIKKLIVEVKKLQNSLSEKAKEFDDVIKMGRTHLQEALPIRLGQEFAAYASVIGRDLKRMDAAIETLSEVNIGGTAMGTGVNADPKYVKKVIYYINKFSGEELKQGKDLIDLTRNLDSYIVASNTIKTLATNLARMANDIRLMTSNGYNGYSELILPRVQYGSSIMPGKYNPVIPEVINQVSFYIVGLDVTVANACASGELEVNVYQPVILMALFEELSTLRHAVRAFNDNCISGLKVGEKARKRELNLTTAIITALTHHIGHDNANRIAEKAEIENRTIREIVVEEKLLTNEQLDIILDSKKLTMPGIPGAELIEKKK